MRVTHKDPVIASLGEESPVPLTTQCDTRPYIHTRFGYGVGGKNLGCGVSRWIESVKGIVAGSISDCRLGKFLGSMEDSIPARNVNIGVALGIQVNNGIDFSRKDMQIAAWYAVGIQSGGVDAEPVVTKIKHYAEIGGKIHSGPAAYVPTGVQISTGVSHGFIKSSAHVE